ncbi:regulator of chromosome condensation 1/beta-lactamase-inhibitor protein II [Cokeromyces recurvatus]|uniref:regulator of chromosome condensation 1/beta-lactamase-inhibitor protein II n=1 Tax=Cokeromyces recurvatus TaxID=90255 RepID=UPI002220F564|nr:regulator of chromosome condensation 1/beta-lactamase-inhibitor protein II [Cokeromyces recurvatus]KAI7904447.1 regulator of chromosome condensation 1/beta-lactamase-inhibitor protein II [Cokeromyces recurvatus]
MSKFHTINKFSTRGKTVLYGWGQSLALPLARGHLDRVFKEPVCLKNEQDFALPKEQEIINIATGWGHSLLGTKDHQVYAFGLNQSGQLGTSQSGGLVMSHQPIKFLACGREHSHIVTKNENGTTHLYSFGNNMYGQLGLGQNKNTNPGKMMLEREPKVVQQQISGMNIKHIVCGLDHTILATEEENDDDSLWGMGWSADGQLGQGKEDKDRPSKLPLSSGQIKKLASSTDFTLALNHDGRIWVWGNSEYGQGVQGKIIDRILEPLEVKVKNVVDIAAGGPFSVLLTNDGTVHTCGYGALGLGKEKIQTLELTKIECLKDIKKVFATTDYAAAITESGELYTWGLNGPSGRLGLGHCQHSFEPKRVNLTQPVLDVYLGTNHALAVCAE